MRALLLATLLASCGSPAKSTPAEAPVAAPVPVPVPVPAPEETSEDVADVYGPAGAVPIPGEMPPLTLEQIDTTITDAELAAITAWPATKRSRNLGEVWVVLHATEKDDLELGVVENNRGVTARYPLGKAKRVTGNRTFDGDTYPSRDRTGDYQGHILFAIRVTPPGGTTPDQVVVFRDGTTLRAARRPLGAKDWKAVVAIAFPKGVTFQGIGTTDPH